MPALLITGTPRAASFVTSSSSRPVTLHLILIYAVQVTTLIIDALMELLGILATVSADL